MKNRKNLVALVPIWLGWFSILYGFQALVTARLDLARPDTSVFWSAPETMPDSNEGKIYLIEPFLNRQVAWDSEYYVGIAVGGYDDPAAGTVINPTNGATLIKNYSFFPLYPYIMHAVMLPLVIFGLNAIATASLAGVIVSVLGTLAGMIALWELTHDYLDEDGAFRAIFYLLIFPTGFFLAQVYTEGLFIGLSFWCLLLLKRQKLLWASVLAVFAAWARAHGVLLAIPIGIAWLSQFDWKKNVIKQFNWEKALNLGCVFLPLAAYLAWRYTAMGEGWAMLQTALFGRGFLLLDVSVTDWIRAFQYAIEHPQGLVYFGIEVFTILVSMIAAFWFLRREPQIALYSLAIIIFSVFSGSALSMARYVLVAPANYIFLAHLGRHRAFDRVWVIASILIMGMSFTLFSFDMWAG
jgi:hypothetical protein